MDCRRVTWLSPIPQVRLIAELYSQTSPRFICMYAYKTAVSVCYSSRQSKIMADTPTKLTHVVSLRYTHTFTTIHRRYFVYPGTRQNIVSVNS